ncbi:MAG: Spy/CpxP family protein refolding chaperone [Spirochaetes bacterium]|nr:Spy/CpxP family protein refolding chaperone [Spirochaetota bacterium]
MNISRLLAVAAAVMLLAQPALYAQRGGEMRGDRECPMVKTHHGPVFGDPTWMQKELGLSDAQVAKIADINKEHQKKMLAYREKLAPMKIQLKRLLLEDKVDMAKVRSLIKDMADIRADLQVLRIQHRLDIEKTLTPEQKAKMKAHRGHMRKGVKHDMKDRQRGPATR